MARLSIPAKNIEAFSSPNPVGGVPWTPNAPSSYTSGVGTTTNFPDQPWLVTGRGLDPASNTVKDRIYIGFNDLGLYPGRTASVRSSTDGGATWTNTVIESAVPAGRQDDPSVRVAVNGNTVYAVFARWGTDAFHGTGVARFSDVVIVRDDNGATGPTKFGALGITGVPIVTTQVPFTVGTPGPSNQVSLGNERIAATLAIAVDPNDKNHVYVAVTEVPGTVNSGQMRVAVYESRNGGQSWSTTPVFATPTDPNFRAAIPALAVTGNGNVGLMYTAYDVIHNKLEQHFVTTATNFVSSTDSVLERFTNGTVPYNFDPYLGDFMDLEAIDSTFYGAFSSSNNLRDAEFPSGLPSFQRNTSGSDGTFTLLNLLDQPVGFSVDPYFFSLPTAAAVPEPSTLLVLIVGLGGLGRISRRCARQGRRR